MAEVLEIQVQGTEALTRRLLELGEDMPRAVTRALNRTLGTVRTATVRALAEETALRPAAVRPSVAMRRATFRNQVAVLGVSGKRIPLIAFDARGPEPSRGRGRGVSYRLPGGRGRIPAAFIATMRTGHRGVFKRREGVGRLPIHELFGPSLPGAFVRARIAEAMRHLADEALAKNLDHEIGWILSRRAQADGAEGAA